MDRLGVPDTFDSCLPASLHILTYFVLFRNPQLLDKPLSPGASEHLRMKSGPIQPPCCILMGVEVSRKRPKTSVMLDLIVFFRLNGEDLSVRSLPSLQNPMKDFRKSAHSGALKAALVQDATESSQLLLKSFGYKLSRGVGSGAVVPFPLIL